MAKLRFPLSLVFIPKILVNILNTELWFEWEIGSKIVIGKPYMEQNTGFWDTRCGQLEEGIGHRSRRC